MSLDPGTPVAIRAARLFDAVSPEPITDGVVCVEGGGITAVGAASAVRSPPEAQRLELGDRTLLPGLMEVHVHLSGSRSYNEAATERDLLTLRAAADCRRLLDIGVTTVRDVGSMTALSLRRAIADGEMVGPRIYAAGP